jgi:hypothetical protein
MKQELPWSAGESRLLKKGDLKQLGEDIRERHLRADDPLALAGSVVMAPAVALSKVGNAIVGQFSSAEAEPLDEGGLAYMRRDIRSATQNLLETGRNILTLHPIRALGSALKTGFDVVDIATVDPLLDIGSGLFGHQYRKSRSQMAEVLAA